MLEPSPRISDSEVKRVETYIAALYFQRIMEAFETVIKASARAPHAPPSRAQEQMKPRAIDRTPHAKDLTPPAKHQTN